VITSQVIRTDVSAEELETYPGWNKPLRTENSLQLITFMKGTSKRWKGQKLAAVLKWCGCIRLQIVTITKFMGRMQHKVNQSKQNYEHQKWP
jgi:hypothetical protein